MGSSGTHRWGARARRWQERGSGHKTRDGADQAPRPGQSLALNARLKVAASVLIDPGMSDGPVPLSAASCRRTAKSIWAQPELISLVPSVSPNIDGPASRCAAVAAAEAYHPPSFWGRATLHGTYASTMRPTAALRRRQPTRTDCRATDWQRSTFRHGGASQRGSNDGAFPHSAGDQSD
jgi:hypothetical protein